MRKIKQFLANKVSGFFKKSYIRYNLVLPFLDTLTKSPDEEILTKAMKFAAHTGIEGDYLEFGVWKARTFTAAYYARRSAKSPKLDKMKFYAFDSFEGLPEIKSKFDKESDEFKKGDYKCDLETFKRILVKNRVRMKDVVIVPGWYDETLNTETKNKLGIKRASVIYVDCDLYESTVPVLDFIVDYITDGTIIVFDDWFAYMGNPDLGEQRAFREWLEKNPSITATEWLKANWKTNSFILHKK